MDMKQALISSLLGTGVGGMATGGGSPGMNALASPLYAMPGNDPLGRLLNDKLVANVPGLAWGQQYDMTKPEQFRAMMRQV